MIKFSILTSSHNRAQKTKRMLESVLSQDYDSFEIILIDDGSTDGLETAVRIMYDPRIKYLRNEVRQERVISLGRAIEEASGEWLMTLDADDLMFPSFLSLFERNINKYPDYKLFNYGWLSIWKESATLRPGKDFAEGEEFPSGLIASGSFAWHFSLTGQIQMPPAKNCYEFADMAGIPGYDGKTKTLGNPWGQDYYMWWKLTRENASKRLPIIGTIVNIR